MAGRVLLLTGALAVALTTGFDWPTRTERLLDQLAQHSDAAARADLVRLLSALPDARARDALLILARDAQPNVRAEALRGLAAQGSAQPSAPFTGALTDEDAAVRAQAAAALGRLRASEAAPALTRLLGDADASVRVAAARALGKLRDAQPATALAAALEDGTLEVRLAAMQALADSGAHEAFDVLLAKLRDPTPELRVAAVDALPRLDPARAQAALREALSDASEIVVIAALRALAAVSLPYTPEVEGQLLLLSEHRRERLAQAARAVLARAAPSPAASAQDWLPLLERSADVPPDQEGVLLRELESRLPAGEALTADPLRLWLARAQAPHRGRIARLIARARPRHAAELLPLTNDSDPAVRQAIVVALGTSGDAQAGEALMARLVDRDAPVAEAAARSLAQLAVPQTLDRLASWLESMERGDAQRVRTARALAHALERLGSDLDSPRQRVLRELLVRLLGDRDPAVAALAARGLGGFPGSSAALLQAAIHRPALVRIAALRASATDRSDAAQRVRRAAARDRDPRIATTAWIAQWRAGDRLAHELLREKLQGATWPLGPVAAFLLASREPEAIDAALGCATLSAPEPLTRTNGLAALARTTHPTCAALSEVPSWLESSRVWPLRTAAARWLSHARSEAHQALLARCERGDGHPVVRATCAQREAAPQQLEECNLLPVCPLPTLAGEGARSTARSPAGTYRALVLADGRTLVSAADAADEVRWPGVPHVAEENPWQWGYGQE